MNSFDTQIHIEELEIMNEKLFYDTKTEKYITESDLWNGYEDYLDKEDSDHISFEEFVDNLINIDALEKVGF